MVSSVLASVLQSYLGQYLELSDTSISVGSEIRLNNVKLKESALSDLGLPVKCVHGKVSKLVIKIPWLNLFAKKTTIEVEGLHLLVVPSTAVKYDEKKERAELNEAKQKRLQRTEDARRLREQSRQQHDADDDQSKHNEPAAAATDTFAERLVANIIKNLEVTISRVHIRYEDQQQNTGRYPFATGITLYKATMRTTGEDGGNDGQLLKIFEKHVNLESLAVYWKPKATLFTRDDVESISEDVIDLLFDDNIGSRESPVEVLKYLLGPISSQATLRWCPSPSIFEYTKPQVDLSISMEELRLSLTKYQQQDFIMLLQSFEFMSRANKFRKYKARHGLENLPNYQGRLRDLWKFAFECVQMEEVVRKMNNWSWEHIKEHVNRCKQYKRMYIALLSTAHPTDEQKREVRAIEDFLDEINIRIQRQLAEREVEKLARIRESERQKSSGFWSWWSGSSSSSASQSLDPDATTGFGNNIKKLEDALSPDEKNKLYELLDYQENAHHGIFPKSFVSKKFFFKLEKLLITIRDDDLANAAVLRLNLETVQSAISLRPSADHFAISMSMEKLTVTGLERPGRAKVDAPLIVKTLPRRRTAPGSPDADGAGCQLLNFSFENNPPENPDGNLDEDKGSLYDQRIRFHSSPLEIVLDAATIRRLTGVFRTPEELNLSTLQHTAASKLKEYREATTLGLQYAIDNHNLVDVDIQLMSSNIVLPHSGRLTSSCACVVANLGSIRIKSKPISVQTRSLRQLTQLDVREALRSNLRDQAYDKFQISLDDMQLLVGLPSEDWRVHMAQVSSPLFLLKPTSLKVTLQHCLIKNDPEMPLVKVDGRLQSIAISASDYRLIKFAQIIDTFLDAEEEELPGMHRAESDLSMASALSSLANSGSLMQSTIQPSMSEIAPLKPRTSPMDAETHDQMVKMNITKFVLNFRIDTVELSLSQLEKGANRDEELFHFTLEHMSATAKLRNYDLEGKFKIGGVTCEHLLCTTPDLKPVHILNTQLEEGQEDDALLQITYTDVNRSSPDFQTLHQSVLKKLEIKLSSVRINVHQDAIMDLLGKVKKFAEELSRNSKRLFAANAEHTAEENFVREAAAATAPTVGHDDSFASQSHHPLTRQNANRRLTRKLTMRTSATLSRWAFGAKKRSLSVQNEIVELKVVASLASVHFDFMTSRIYFARLLVKDLAVEYVHTKSQKVITARLIDFQIHDALNSNLAAQQQLKTRHEMIAESLDQKVFDARIVLQDYTKEMKRNNLDAVDVEVEASMGRVKLVFLMKFVQDFLNFLEPFTGAKEMLVEQAQSALEGAAKSMTDAYANATRVKLNIHMDAPVIIIPVHSLSTSTLIADLGTLRLSNRFFSETTATKEVIFDMMHFEMSDLKLSRARIDENIQSNRILADCLIVKPVNLELDIRRNMSSAISRDDPPEISVQGTLNQITVELSKQDYNVLMALLQNNFTEKGQFETLKPTPKASSSAAVKDRASLALPVRKSYSRANSRSSVSSERSVRSIRAAIKADERDPLAQMVEFNFQFQGFEAVLFNGDTPLVRQGEVRNADLALARFTVKVLRVEGNVQFNAVVRANATLEDCVLEDGRNHHHHSRRNNKNSPDEHEAAAQHRIVRLMEAKASVAGSAPADDGKMIVIDYKRSVRGDQAVDITIHSFILVSSVSYLLEIANFFVLDQETSEWVRAGLNRPKDLAMEGIEVSGLDNDDDEASNHLIVDLKIEEPDIFLVENIEDVNTDALMLNTELQLKYEQRQDSMNLMASLASIRCHTCRFNPTVREETLAQILQPCTVSLNLSRSADHGTRVHSNLSDICLNVSPHSIEIIQNSVEAFIASMAAQEGNEQVEDRAEEYRHDNLWAAQRIKEDEHWFLKPEESIDALDTIPSTFGSTQSLALDEVAIIEVNNLVIKIESGVGNNTIPLLLFESRFSCDVKNWSTSRMCATGSLELEMAYYNSKLALWEPVIEPLCLNTSDGTTKNKRWALKLSLESCSENDFGSTLMSPSFDEPDAIISAQNFRPLRTISLQSTDILELTITKSFMSVINSLVEAFSEVRSGGKKSLPVSPFIIENYTGKTLTLMLDSKGFKYFSKDTRPGERSHLELQHDTGIELYLFKDRTSSQHLRTESYVSPLQEQNEQAEASLRVRVQGESGMFELPVSKADKRFFPFKYRGDEMGDNHGMVSEVYVNNGCKYITLRSIIQVKNHFDKAVNIYTHNAKNPSNYDCLTCLQPDQTFNVPLKHVYSDPYQFSFKVDGRGQNIGLEEYPWRELINKPMHSQKIECSNSQDSSSIFLNVVGTKEEIFWQKSGKLSAVSYTLDIRPLLVLKNCLPVVIHYGRCSESLDKTIEPGGTAYLQSVRFGETKITFKIFEHRNTDWECTQVMDENMMALSLWRFTADDHNLKLDLGINATLSHGTQVLSIYAPFWMINKTGKHLTYKGQDPQNLVYHPVERKDIPVMFSYTTKNFFEKRKTCIRMENSSWSDAFSLDTIEDAGKVVCKTPDGKRGLSVGVNINMSMSSLTKIITFTPFYLILNTAQFSVSIRELDSNGDVFEIAPAMCMPFWPQTKSARIVARVSGTPEETSAFSLTTAHSTLLMLGNRFGAIHVECRTSNSETLLTLSSYKKGLAPVQLVNHTKHCMIEFSEKAQDGLQLLHPLESVLYTWLDPDGPRTLVWSIHGYKEEYENTLIADDLKIIRLDQDQEVCWVSFLNGLQRVLLFTEDRNLCFQLANSTGKDERISTELELSLQGVGISVINNAPNCSKELIYASVSCSDIVWEIKRQGKHRFKPLNRAQCEALENDFQQYCREKSIGRRTDSERNIVDPATKLQLQVNYERPSRMYHPIEGQIQRQYQRALWLQIRTSAHQRQLHLKIHRIQIDNQLRACLFPVIMAPVPPPRSVLAESIPKPFIELSVLEYMSPEHNTLHQYKYIHALVQELHLKVDQGLLNAYIDLFEEEEILDEDINAFLAEDLNLAKKELKDIAKLKVTEGHKDFFDNLHLSPLKVHVSFSLTSYKSSSSSSTRRSNFLGLFLQSLGVTVTDIDDIIFRLAYFERKHQFFSHEDLTSEMTRHYTSQAIKQAYVVIFGLDVIGNPFGFVVGVTRSVEDFFYEPFQGAVEGPSEFAEGMLIGVRSVVSGVFGGAAGTVSKITGALGKGLASLTFDENFQRKRREAIKKRGKQTFRESMARSSKGLAMGFVDGVTGVVAKPIEGAREEGVGGFIKGMGKGVVGFVARPTGGIIDFASGTFDTVRRAAQLTEEVRRVRPTRFLHPDGVVRNFNLKEAEGNRILTNLEKGKYADSDFYVAHESLNGGAAAAAAAAGAGPAATCAFMVTNKRVMELAYGQIMGSWSITWEYTYAEIQGPPSTEREADNWYVIIRPKEEQRKFLGLFGGSDSGKRIAVASRYVAQRLSRTIEELRTL